MRNSACDPGSDHGSEKDYYTRYHCYIEQPVKSEYGRQHGTTLMLNFQVFLVPLWLHKRTSLFTGETLPNNLG